MKGLILGGGYGTRLKPITPTVNKHLLPIGKYPAIYYPLHTLISMGIEDIMVIDNSQAQMPRALGSGEDFGVNLTYRFQDEAKGIAHAISFAKDFSRDSNLCVILGDNIFEQSMGDVCKDFQHGARIFLREVVDPSRFGVPVFNEQKEIVKIEEKPKEPKSGFAVTGLYMYDTNVFDYIEGLKPSSRGELEVTDLNNIYLGKSQLDFKVLQEYWSDAGTFESLHAANVYVRSRPFHWFIG